MRLRNLSIVVLVLLAWAAVPGTNPARAGNLIFSDDFNGASLDPAWQVLSGQGAYALSGGALIYSNQGPLSSPNGWVTTSLNLVLPFSGTNWQFDTQATFHLVWNNAAGASSGAQFSNVAIGFNPALPFADMVRFDRGVDAWYLTNMLAAWSTGGDSVSDLLDPADLGIVNNIADGTYWYRILRNGGSVTMMYSYDGVAYNTAFSTTLANPAAPDNLLILSGTTYQTAGSSTAFEFVTITGVDRDTSVPEPGTLALFSLGAAAIAIKAWRRRA